MSKNIDCIAFHEAGHAVAYILAGIPFKSVTIKEDSEKDEHGERSLGHIEFEKPLTKDDWDQYSFLNPEELNVFFKDDFTKLAGLVAEKMYRGRSNFKAARGDFKQWIDTSLNQLPDSLRSKYISFILEYTSEVFRIRNNWSNITAVALALVEEETLSYGRVKEVIEQNQVNPVIK